MASAAVDKVTLTVQPPVAVIRFNNPKSLNSINGAILHRLAYLLDEVAERPDITVTVLTGTGRFFSSGGDVGLEKPGGGKPEEQESAREWLLTNFCMPWLTATRSVFRHPKILVAALNGPVVGAPAGLVAFADFIYAMPHTYLATPFTSLALGAEGGSSFSLKERLGAAKTNEALLMGKRITCQELVQCGFINKVFKANSESDNDTFMKQVLSEIHEWLGPHLDPAALLLTKRQLRAEDYERQDAVVVKEVMGALNAFLTGRPQAESKKFMTGQKRHKL
ncbi:hypothetical protein ABEF95_001704 [Exophiala dermatitidis]